MDFRIWNFVGLILDGNKVKIGPLKFTECSRFVFTFLIKSSCRYIFFCETTNIDGIGFINGFCLDFFNILDVEKFSLKIYRNLENDTVRWSKTRLLRILQTLYAFPNGCMCKRRDCTSSFKYMWIRNQTSRGLMIFHLQMHSSVRK